MEKYRENNDPRPRKKMDNFALIRNRCNRDY
jgi:hypothetical protein